MVMALPVKLKKYIILVDYIDEIDKNEFDDFIVWAYSRHHAIQLVENYLFPNGSTPRKTNFTIYKLRIITLFSRLFNKIPDKPVCNHI